MKIALCTLTIGNKFKEDTKYGHLTKVIYANKHGYDLIDDPSVADHSKHLAWSKVHLILKYLSKYDYLVWIDADTVLTNDELKLEDFITNYLKDKELMYVSAREWVNTGVMFIKNTKFMHDFFQESFAYPDKICWEQGAIDHLWRINWENCRDKIVILPDQRICNSDWYHWEWGQFLVHFPGCGVDGRVKDCLKRMIEMFCTLKMDEETNEDYQERLNWLKYRAGKQLPIIKKICDQTGKYFPLDL